MSTLPRQRREAQIPYSRFLQEVRDDGVASVTIVGERISGKLVKPISWPPPAAKPPAPKAPDAGEPAATDETPAPYEYFRTVLPSIGDPRLLPLLDHHHVVIDVQETTTPWLFELLIAWGPFLLLVGLFGWMSRQAMRRQAGIFGLGRSTARRYARERPDTTFDSVAGADEAKADLREEVDFLRQPTKYHRLGARIPRGVLLVGLPGTGKTLLARAVAGEARVPFFSLSGSEFVEMFVGVGASRVRDLFEQAKAAAPESAR